MGLPEAQTPRAAGHGGQRGSRGQAGTTEESVAGRTRNRLLFLKAPRTQGEDCWQMEGRAAGGPAGAQGVTEAGLGTHSPSEQGLAGGLAWMGPPSRCLGSGRRSCWSTYGPPTGHDRPEGSLVLHLLPCAQPAPPASAYDAPLGKLGEGGEHAS